MLKCGGHYAILWKKDTKLRDNPQSARKKNLEEKEEILKIR